MYYELLQNIENPNILLNNCFSFPRSFEAHREKQGAPRELHKCVWGEA